MERAVAEAKHGTQATHFPHGAVTGVMRGVHLPEREAEETSGIEERRAADRILRRQGLDLAVDQLQCTRLDRLVLVSRYEITDDVKIAAKRSCDRCRATPLRRSTRLVVALARVNDGAFFGIEERAKQFDSWIRRQAVRWNLREQCSKQPRAAEHDELPATSALDETCGPIDIAGGRRMPDRVQDDAVLLEPYRCACMAPPLETEVLPMQTIA